MNPVEPLRDMNKIVSIKRRLRKENPRDYLLFVLGLNTALRIGDLLDLHVKDVIDKDGNVRGFLTLRENKTGKDKRVKLNDAAVEAVSFYMQRVKPQSDAWLFPGYGKCALTRQQVWNLINKWCRAVGINDRVGAHTLRKSWGYQARKAGIALELIQAKLGHASPMVTRRYIGITADEIEDVENHINL